MCASVVVVIGHAHSADDRDESRCRSVRGHAVTHTVPASACTSPVGFCTEGKVYGGLKGELTFVVSHFIDPMLPSIPNVTLYLVRSTIRTHRGDILIGTDSGALDLKEGVGAALITWTEGSGRFAGVSGYTRVSPSLDRETNTVFSEYEGQICVPR